MPRDLVGLSLAALLTCVGCGDAPTPPSRPPPVRDALFLRLDDGAVYLVRTDGSNPRRVTPPGLPAFTPIALAEDGATIALLRSDTIALATLEDPGTQRVIASDAPPGLGPAAFSADGQRLAIPCVLPAGPAVLLYDQARQRWDTVVVGAPGFFQAPAFSPDGTELAGIGVTPLSMYMVRVQVAALTWSVTRIEDSKVLNPPVFGWPRWTADRGLLFLVRRGVTSPGRDTLVVVAARPANPEAGLERLYAVLMTPGDSAPDVVFAAYSTFALAADGNQFVIAAQPDTAAPRHALYAAAHGEERIHRVLEDPAQFPVYPRLLR